MPKLKINAPDGKTIRIDVPQGSTPDQYDSIVDDVLADYAASKVESPGTLKSGALGVMSGVPGGQTLTSAVSAIGDKTYEQAHSELEALKGKAWEEHPVAYGVGKTAGIAGTALVVPASIPAAVGVGAAAGLDVASKPEEFISSATKGAAGGGVFGAAGKYIAAPAATAVMKKFLPGLGKRAVSTIGDPNLKQVESYLKNPEAIRKALSNEGVAQKIAEVSRDLGKASGHLSMGARSALNPKSTPLTTKNLAPIFEDAMQPYLTSGKAATALDDSAIKLLDAQAVRLMDIAKANNGTIPEPALRTVIDKLQKMAAFNEEGQIGTSLKQKIAGDLQFRLKKLLEEANPLYKEAMIPSAQAAKLSGKLQETFKLERGKPTDATIRQAASILKEPKIEERALIDQIKDMTGDDIAKLIVESQTKGAFEAPGAGAALKTFMTGIGFGAGKVSGIPFAGIGGAAAGRFGSEAVHGGNMAKKILDAYLDTSAAWQDSAVRGLLDKYGPILVNAARQGGNQLAATHFVLGTSDPDYQGLEEQMPTQ